MLMLQKVKKKLFYFNINFSNYCIFSLILLGGERGLISYFEKKQIYKQLKR